jgi:hypothetical protein
MTYCDDPEATNARKSPMFTYNYIAGCRGTSSYKCAKHSAICATSAATLGSIRSVRRFRGALHRIGLAVSAAELARGHPDMLAKYFGQLLGIAETAGHRD